MAKWEIVSEAKSYNVKNPNHASRGWLFKIANTSEQRWLGVEFVPTGGPGHSAGPFPDDVMQALNTRGRSAVEAVLDRTPR
jgi:hypothetical protein